MGQLSHGGVETPVLEDLRFSPLPSTTTEELLWQAQLTAYLSSSPWPEVPELLLLSPASGKAGMQPSCKMDRISVQLDTLWAHRICGGWVTPPPLPSPEEGPRSSLRALDMYLAGQPLPVPLSLSEVELVGLEGTLCPSLPTPPAP